MIKKVLITGCNGYLGSNLIRELDKRDGLICITRNAKNNQISYYDKENIENAIKNCNVVVHLAAIINPFDRYIYDVNVNFTKFLVDKARKYNKRFIFISTQNVLFGKDAYSNSKKEAENIVKTLKDYIILRPTIIYGKNETRYIGRLIKFIKKSYFVPIIGNGKNKLQPIYVEDLVKIIKYCIDKKIEGVFLTAGNPVISYNELINLIIKKLKLVRIKFHIPIIVIKPFAYLFQNLLKNPPITTTQLYNLKINKTYNIKNIEKTFNIKLKNINDGLDLIL